MDKTKVSVIVLSCDKNHFLWDGFFKLLEKYWPNHPPRLVLSTETLSFNGVIVSNSRSKNEDWSTRVFHAICDANTEYVILMLDDFFIREPVDERRFENYLEIMQKDKNVAAISLESQPGCKKGTYLSEGLVKRRRFDSYRINAQPTVWSSKYLTKILRQGESPWQFELSGTFRSFFAKGELYAIDKNQRSVIPTDKGWLIVRGVLNNTLVDYYQENEDIDLHPYLNITNQKNLEKSKPRFVRLIGYYTECIKSLGYKKFYMKEKI